MSRKYKKKLRKYSYQPNTVRIDDEIIGIKSTSIKFKNNVKVFVSVCYGLFALLVLT